MKFSRGAICAIGVLLSGCTAWQVATFNSSEYSFKRKGAKAWLAVTGMGDPALAGSSELKFNVPGEEGRRIAQACDIPPPPSSGGTTNTFAAAGLLVAVAGVLIDAGIAKIDDWTDKKIKEFKDDYSVRINVPQFGLPKGNAKDEIKPRTKCLIIQRDVDVSTTDEKRVRRALTLVLRFEPMGDQAYVLKPIYLDLVYSGARTSQEGNAVNLDFTVGVAVVKSGHDALVRDLVAIQSYSLKKIALRGDNAELPDYRDKFQAGTIIPALDGPTAGSIVFAMTETGDGSDDFSGFRKDVDTYGKVLKDFGIDQLKGALGVK
ncbi:MAG TPA: hypothetical protein VKY24_19570 [Reyranella sp.]|nr:hypothetical protein [Reyranella sp.]